MRHLMSPLDFTVDELSVLMDLAELLVGHIRGALGHVNVVLSAMMGGLSGSCAADAAQEDVLAQAKAEQKVADAINGMTIVKEIYIKGRLVNIVVKPQK